VPSATAWALSRRRSRAGPRTPAGRRRATGHRSVLAPAGRAVRPGPAGCRSFAGEATVTVLAPAGRAVRPGPPGAGAWPGRPR
jgi:hypothetical protein